MYVRYVIAALVAVLLLATHWKSYVAGKNSAQYTMAIAAVKQSEAARKEEQRLVKKNEEIDRELQKQKKRNADIARTHAERLRVYEDALAGASAPAEPTGRADGPFAAIANECGRALVEMDKHAKELERIAGGLQKYADEMCVTTPTKKED